MYEPDLPAFEIALNRLCAGFNTPPTEARKDAYWLAFRKLQIREFERLVSLALSAEFTTMPTVGALWELHRKSSYAQPPASDGPSIQAQLCEYACQHVHDKAGPKDSMTLWEYSRPWTYVYREWRDETRPKGLERCAECIGLIIELDNGKRIGWSVAAMRADAEGHAKALKAFTPGPKPTREQMEAWHSKLPHLTP
jgi:hypothetical protein